MLAFLLNEPAICGESNVSPMLLEEIQNKTLRPFFNALKNGNVEQIKRFFSGKMYSEYRLLLEENKGYPDLLREYYKDAVFSVERGITSDNRIIVDFSVEIPGKRKQVSQYILQEQNIENVNHGQTDERLWRITEQRHVQAK